LLQNSAGLDCRAFAFFSPATLFAFSLVSAAVPIGGYLCEASSCQRWRGMAEKLGEPPQVLRGSCKRHFVPDAAFSPRADVRQSGRHVSNVPIVLKNSKIARLRKSRKCCVLSISAAATLCRIDMKAGDRFCGN
jgi:hypothetical protein